jgi:haloacid dehalogenase superfamily, subfamily IA, variant 1 with third motif having Dx(3-4)D or Dx(3-4)E
MKSIKLIAFDADDTLWVNELNYRNAEAKFVTLMAPYASAEKAIEVLFRIEISNLPLLGYGSKPFIISLIESGIELSSGHLSNNEVLQLIAIGKETMERPMTIYPDVEDVLELLSQKYPLILATKGDLKEQESKIERSGLKKHFAEIEIMSEKSAENYRKIIAAHNISPQEFLMIGNSFKSDILPVLEVGGKAIYIPCDLTWAHEVAEEIEHPNLVKVSAIKDILPYMHI